jgi:8-oxo-dGTP pyrophosphatase MutT (NUDIX family)
MVGVSDSSSKIPEDCSASSPWAHWLKTLVPTMFRSYAALARAVGVHPAQVARWRRGAVPRLDVMRRLAEATGVSPEYLLWIARSLPGAEDDDYRPPEKRAGAPAVLQPVVAAIVVSDLGVLIGRRRDGKPPWTFIAGEQEPGERPEDTAIREVKEETACEIRTGRILGQRTHPATGRRMTYVAAEPVSGTAVIVGDEAELAEVRWVGLQEAIELLPGMFPPVLEFLEQAIPRASDS